MKKIQFNNLNKQFASFINSNILKKNIVLTELVRQCVCHSHS